MNYKMHSNSENVNVKEALYICQYPLDRHHQAIQINGSYLRLRDKLWNVLVCLLENKSFLISRNELIEQFWDGNSFTGEQGTTHAICHLRKIFKQYNIDATIMTIPKRGYVLQEKSDPLEL